MDGRKDGLTDNANIKCSVQFSLSVVSDSLELYEQAPLFMEFTRQEYWSGLPCLLQGNLPHLGIKPKSFKSPALTG